jgi:hypothetical protein
MCAAFVEITPANRARNAWSGSLLRFRTCARAPLGRGPTPAACGDLRQEPGARAPLDGPPAATSGRKPRIQMLIES